TDVTADRSILGKKVGLTDRRIQEVLAEAQQRQGMDAAQFFVEASEVEGVKPDAVVVEALGCCGQARIRRAGSVSDRRRGERRVIVGQWREAEVGELARPLVGIVRFQEERRLAAALGEETVALPDIAIDGADRQGTALLGEPVA